MGADMLLAGFVTSREFAESDTNFREQRKQAILAEIDCLIREQDLLDLCEYLGDTDKGLSDLKAIAKEVTEETFKSLDYRDVTTWYYKDVTFYLTGGMSWGDSPTDTYDCFMKFSLLPDKVLDHLL